MYTLRRFIYRGGLTLTVLAVTAVGQVQAATPWSGILDPSRAVDWSQAGVVGGIPSGSWTQCGATVSSGASVSSIQSVIDSCGTNQYVKLGPGTFNLTTGPIMKSNMVLRGSGADQTLLVFSGDASCGGAYSDICFIGGDSSDWSGDPSTQPGGAKAATWTAGYA